MMKINFILLALTSLFVTVFGGSGGGAPYVDYCKQCADFTNDCVSVSISPNPFRKLEDGF
jgi:hypothetical protein